MKAGKAENEKSDSERAAWVGLSYTALSYCCALGFCSWVFIVVALVVVLALANRGTFRAMKSWDEAPKIAEKGAPKRKVHPSSIAFRFTDVTAQSGINFKHCNGAIDTVTTLETAGSGAAFSDYDGDGLLDLYLVNSSHPDPVTRIPKTRQEANRAARDMKPGQDARSLQESPHCEARQVETNALYRNMGDGIFVDVTAISGVGDAGYGFGCAFGDYDNDGDQDLYVTNFGGNVLYRNDGDGAFTDVTDSTGVSGRRSSENLSGASCAFADYDSDGDLDLYVASYIVFDGTKRFCFEQQVGKRRAEYVKTGCSPTIYDGQMDILYANNGDGTFTDVTRSAGLASKSLRGLGVASGDYDNDGDPDIFVANDWQENFLYQNNGDGSFEDVALFAGVAFDEKGMPDNGMGIDLGDYDNDGDLDCFVTNFQGFSNNLFRNDGNGLFTNVSVQSGVGPPSLEYLGFGTHFFDCDNDGHLDIFVANGHVLDNIALIEEGVSYEQRNQIFRNDGNGRFEDVGAASWREENGTPSFAPPSQSLQRDGLLVEKVSRGAAFGDYDNDGDVDILVSNSNDNATLLRNELLSPGRPRRPKSSFLMVGLIGRQSNRDGLGARVSVLSGSLKQIREAKSGSGYLSDHDRRLHFGLGDKTSVDSLVVRWPSGVRQRFEDVGVNRLIVIVEGNDRLVK